MGRIAKENQTIMWYGSNANDMQRIAAISFLINLCLIWLICFRYSLFRGRLSWLCSNFWLFAVAHLTSSRRASWISSGWCAPFVVLLATHLGDLSRIGAVCCSTVIFTGPFCNAVASNCMHAQDMAYTAASGVQYAAKGLTAACLGLFTVWALSAVHYRSASLNWVLLYWGSSSKS